MIGATYRRLLGVLKRQSELCYNQHRSAYIVLLPEIDPEVADKLVSINEDLPTFSKITTEKIGMFLGKQIVDYECIVRNSDRKLDDAPKLYPDLFEDILDPLEKTICSFDTAWGIFRTLYLVDNMKVPQKTYYTLARRICNARAVLYNSENIFNKCKECDKNKLTEEQARYVDKLLIEGRLNAMDALPKNRAGHIFNCKKLTEKQTYFRLRVEAARAQFFVTIDDPFLMQEVPSYLLKMMSHVGGGSEDGPWTVKLNYKIGEKFLEYCSDRDIRYMIWFAEDKAGSINETARELANSVCLEEIRTLRHEQAQIAGFKNHAEANLYTKMAGSIENINNTLNTLLKAARPAQCDEIAELQAYAESNNCYHPIQFWDVPYWSRKQKMTLFNFSNELLRNYLQFERVLYGLFSLCSRLFDIRIQEVKDFDSWHPDVKFYYIYEPDSEKPVAGFYIDPYIRNNKIRLSSDVANISVIRNSSRIGRPTLPLTTLIMHLEPPSEKTPCLLSFSEAQELFSEFGHSLQYLLNKSSYTEVAGLNFVEYDAVGVCSNFMANWLYDKEVFESITSHYKTGDKAPLINLEGVKNHLAGYRLCKELFKANLDLEMHTKHEIFWLDLASKMWDDHFIFPMSSCFSDPCRYTDVFADNWGAAYYSHLWSEMLAADIYQAFKEEENEASVGARFRDTFLTFGGSCHSSEVFRRFRGRNPQPSALLKHLGLMKYVDTVTDSSNQPTEDPKLVATC